MFDNVLGQDSVKKKLIALFETKRITNAYIFSGPEGVGKHMMAEEFSSMLIGKNVNNSSDYVLVDVKNGESSIKIDQIRNLNSSINIKPYSDYRIYVINNADKMTIQAQNALLKTLEEPSSYGIIILVTRNEQALLDTIRSRCMEVKFSPLSVDDIKSILISKGIESEQAELAAVFSRGSVSLAMEVSKKGDLNDFRRDIEGILDLLIIEKNKFEATRIAEYLKKYPTEIDKSLELMQLYIRDAILMRENVDPCLLINKDRQKIIRKLALSASIAQLGKILDILEKTSIKLSANCNFNSTVQAMALNINEVVDI